MASNTPPPTPASLTAAQQKQNNLMALNKGGKAYDPLGVYTDSTDNGFYETWRTKFPPDTHRLVSQMVSDRDEFRSPQDFIRNAVHHYLHRYIDGDPDIPLEVKDILEMEDHVAELAQKQRDREAMDEVMEYTRVIVNSAVDDEDWNELYHQQEYASEMASREDMPMGRRRRWLELEDEIDEAISSMKKTKTRYEKMAGVTPMKKRRA